uniref:Link domain-containing protein n=1 Tax=viral metagenome TaxID=1070528 RepID=A0A6C0I5W4_9ZZZZ
MDVTYDYVTGIGQNPLEYVEATKNTSTSGKLLVLAILTVTIFIYYIVFSTMPGGTSSAGSGPNTSGGAKLLEVIMWGTFIVLLIINGYQYFFNVNVVTSVKDLFNDQPKLDITLQHPEGDSESTVPQLKYFKQVFHVPGNEYTYSDAKDVCKAFDARLASYDEVEKSYSSGGEWCSYGWSDNQMALFPTQKKTWNRLQNIKGHEHDCGRPGINGGFIANPDVRFGINCYGFKPKITSVEADDMKTASIYPKTLKDVAKQKRVAHWQTKLSDILVSPFNNDVWSA